MSEYTKHSQNPGSKCYTSLAIQSFACYLISFWFEISGSHDGEYKELLASIVALMTEAASTSETSKNFYQTTRCNNPEDSHL
jgi:hypothetical protein